MIEKYFLTKKIKKETKEILSKYGTLREKDKDLIFRFNNKDYYLNFLYVKNDKELFINNQTIWEVYGSNSLIINQRLKEAKTFITIVYPTLTPVKVWINENTVEFVKLRKIYNYYVILFADLERLVETLK